jgi:hypothetical protein
MAEKKTHDLRIRVSAKLHDYLGILADRTMLGTSENDIAEYLLTQRLEQMRRENYHETQGIPTKIG